MRSLVFFLLLGVAFTSNAQTEKVLEPAVLECHYELSALRDTVSRSNIGRDLMILRVGKSISQFFSYYAYTSDSLLATSGGAEKFGNNFIDALTKGDKSTLPGVKTTSDYIYKNYPKGRISLYCTDVALNYYRIVEDYTPQAWEVKDSTREVLGYKCQMATCNYRGRRYVVWFASDIPVSDGPWKLAGLPGLILEAYDVQHHYHYTAVKLLQAGLRPVALYNTDRKYEKTDRITYLRLMSDYLFGRRNSLEDGSAALGLDIKVAASSTSKGKVKQYDFMERDYR